MVKLSSRAAPEDEGRERLLHQLGERVKELTALHSTASIFQQPKPIADLLQEIASILPPAWQYPEVTTARITYDGQEFRTGCFRESPWGQVAGFVTSDGKTGSVEVFYVEEKPPEAEGPFLAEERNLINSLAEMLHIYMDRKLASDALLESEERFRITFEQAAVGIIHVAPDGLILRANRKFCDIIGYSYDEIIEQTLQDITCIHDVPSEAENRDKLTASRIHAYSIEKRNIRKDGKPVWVNETVSLVRLPSGEPKYFIIILEDITDRKQSESERRRLVHDMQERVKELTAMYRTMEILQQQKPVPGLLQEVVSILPDAWQYPEITAARIRFDGRDYLTPNYTASEWRQSARFATYDAFDGFIEVVYLEERPEEAEGPFLAEERNLIESLAQALRGFLNRRKAESALVASESLYHTLADAAHDMVYLKDSDGRFTYFNRYAEDILGEDPEALIGKRNADVYTAVVAAQHDMHEARTGEHGLPVYFEELTRFPHRRLWTANWLVPINGDDRQTTSVMCVVRDIDERKHAEQTLLKAEKELEELRQFMLTAREARDEIDNCISLIERMMSPGNNVDLNELSRVFESLKKFPGL
ncbi:MAG TPA: PAS domain S-box protein [Methanocella sp.]|jgi:PAS domain S-box-containing protein